MQITLSLTAAPEVWGKNAILSANDQGMTIHLVKDELTTIQQAARKIKNQNILNVTLTGEGWGLEQCWAFHQGFVSVKNAGSVTYPALNEQQTEFDARLACSSFTRDIINEPSDRLTPEVLAHKAAEFILHQADKYVGKGKVSFEIVAREALNERGYHGIWSVGKGSAHLPAMLQLDYNPTGNPDAPVLACLVGKGITFDTGGYSLKPSDSMSTMRTDMGGAALVTGALGFAIARGLKQRVKLYLCCAENMVSSRAFKLGDIITYRNGVTAEVLNTDAEGRLVLADGLIEASKQKPQFIVDCATLTGAAKVAVGNDYHSVLSMDDQLVARLFEAAKAENEPFWRLPFEEFHRAQISSSFADIANIGSVPVGAGASTATAFLSYFVENYQQNWLHIDCSATFRKTASDLWAAGATGIGVKTLGNLLLSSHE
ncbi:aminopeptidase PepB [Glaesserella parasuis]|uniref:aminopeptidase PepB n=1 Tax=Glaesserella parasuis TaxID=738 RepID=UPI0003ABFC6F|nr:aminopeptidase PepB [Glaesserella parasuis]EQA01799.1 aminopeptidase B [Glaesserella parasuis SW114]MCT8574363.1 aminopeptidase PepB [Glaesserella parasuis]MCT8655378.1 aminopeptidase PepB [Glaesserella parasuis]MCT8837020.1 aminopeptidase PepB [Glaesserella parasuis]MDD2173387.1 aminopeptidase PepB [Glaesserella parasuis]